MRVFWHRPAAEEFLQGKPDNFCGLINKESGKQRIWRKLQAEQEMPVFRRNWEIAVFLSEARPN
jgi:hypothetical protein